ncbi:hypothetical protein BISU_1981 [Bifidobacterium subtile]|uniref:Uncharacterized protein n=1 Tax=Bifidobacterium subtile TaxID=77635 RepID=A0A087E024_9BIFI|nr:hypothetical protein BISU_1981 [Bifidobacterium subtile]
MPAAGRRVCQATSSFPSTFRLVVYVTAYAKKWNA